MARKPLSENGRKVLDYVRSMRGQNITAADVADGTDLSVKQVNAIITKCFQDRGFMQRLNGEITLEDGMHKPIKLIVETEEGMQYDPDNDPEVLGDKQGKED